MSSTLHDPTSSLFALSSGVFPETRLRILDNVGFNSSCQKDRQPWDMLEEVFTSLRVISEFCASWNGAHFGNIYH
jgi:hypothetical protein